MEEKTAKKVMLSGIQPSGDLTLGLFHGLPKDFYPEEQKRGVSLLLVNSPKGAHVFDTLPLKRELRTLDEAVAAAEEDAFVIGGETVYRALLARCERVYVTKVFAAADADAFFPDLDAAPGWAVEESGPVQEENGLRFQYVTYRRVGE